MPLPRAVDTVLGLEMGRRRPRIHLDEKQVQFIESDQVSLACSTVPVSGHYTPANFVDMSQRYPYPQCPNVFLFQEKRGPLD